MTEKLKIVLCDDDEDRANIWRKDIAAICRGNCNVVVLTKDQAIDCVRQLAQRRKDIRSGKGGLADFGGTEIDEANVLIVDFDLFGFEVDSQILTGEEIAQLARTYSLADVIVVVNQFGPNRFDLTLRGGGMSHADLNIGEVQVANAGIWTAPFVGYRPWSWPLLPKAVEDFRARVDEVKANLDVSLLDFFEFSKVKHGLPGGLSRSALSVLQGIVDGDKKVSIEKFTFRNLVCDAGSFVPKKEAEYLAKHDGIVARLAAAYAHKWLENTVLPSQDVLVDIPHVLERLPWLVDGKLSELESWNLSTSFEKPQGIKQEALRYSFKRTSWISRPVLWWQPIASDEKISVAPSDWNSADVPDNVFREDVSAFGPRADSRQFVAEVEGIADTRYVCVPEKVRAADRATDPRAVEYSPSVRFAM